MKRKCPDCGKKKVSSKEDRKYMKELTRDTWVPVNTCIDCYNFYDSVEQERMSDHYAGR